MFPIDSNLLIAILIVITISAYILILKKIRPKSTPTDNILRRNSKKQNPKTTRKDKNVRKEIVETTQQKKSRSACSHHFGYLRTLPKNASLPDECLGCPNIIECLTHAQIKKSHGKQK